MSLQAGTTLELAPRQPFNLWTWLRTQVDKAGYRPIAAPGIVVRRLVENGGAYYVLKNPTLGTYQKLSEADYLLWEWMDGSRTVKDLVVAYFQQHKTFAFGRIAALVDELRANGFLTDRPVGVYQQVKRQLVERDWSHRWGRLARAFLEREFVLDGVDGLATSAYRRGGRLLFTLPALAALALLAVAGLFAFGALVARERGYAILAPDNSSPLAYAAGLLALLLINLVMIFIHESAHALATKHFGREVRRGGFMIYYGMPAFFVDTVDMWLEPKRRRLAVTSAGPCADLVVAGVCSLLALAIADPTNPAGALLFKAAFLGYLSVFINLNPLLELDGYFLLSDGLGIPGLRRRSLAFVREELPGKLRALLPGGPEAASGGETGAAARFSREEVIFTVFGVLAAVYTLYAVAFAVYFWQTRISDVLRDLWSKPPPVIFKPLVALLVAAVLVPAGMAAAAALWSAAARLAGWLERRRFFERERNVAILALAGLGLLLLLPALPGQAARGALLAGLPVLLAGLAVWALAAAARQYAGAEVQAAFWGLALAAGLWLLGASLRAPGTAPAIEPFKPALAGLALLAEQLAAVGLLVAGIGSLAGVDLRRGPAWEQVAMAALLALGFVAVLPVARWTAGWPMVEVIAALISAYFTLIFLALITPTLTAYRGTPFLTAWVGLALAAGLSGALALARAAPEWPAGEPLDGWLGLAAAGLWATGGLSYVTAGARLRFPAPHWSYSLAFSEEQRLRSAFARFVETLFAGFRATFGARRAQAVDDELDVISAAADWDVEIDAGRVRDELDLDRISVLEQADRYREILARTMDLMDDWAGSRTAARMAQAAYDSLPWPERETLGRYVLAGTPWGAAIAERFASARGERDRLLRGVPFLAALNNRDFYLLQAAFRVEEAPAGRTLARRGSPVQRFVVIQSGEIEVWQPDQAADSEQLVDELRRGASFGSEVFLGRAMHNASCRASVDSVILSLSAADAARLRRAGVEVDAQAAGALSTARLLARMPMFAHLGPHQVAALAGRMQRVTAEPGHAIVRQGERGHFFYVIVQGQVAVSLRDQAGGETILAHLGRGEHFGETGLYADEPATATCRAETAVELLALDEPSFDALVAASRQMAHYVSQVSSGLSLDARRKVRRTDNSS
jgi:putative peptide zinc metalloprotease protein